MTPHIEALKEEIADVVIMPGDPLRAKFIAKTYLKDAKQVTAVRGMLGFTGYYKGKRVTVMGSGMGMASIGIYSYELYKFYDVKKIIRVGSCGAYTDKLNLYDLILVSDSYSLSSYAKVLDNFEGNTLASSASLNTKIKKAASALNYKLNVGTIYSTDVFYGNPDIKDLYENHHCLGVEMETFALFYNAKILNREASAILTVSDSLITDEKTSSKERETSFTAMIELALEAIL